MRVLLAALGLSALSFAAGVAGDLSVPAHSASVVVQIPPLPPNAVHAHPLPPLTEAANAAEIHPQIKAAAPAHRHRIERASRSRTMAHKPRAQRTFAVSKAGRSNFAKWDI